jgi:hypothetical protein
MTKKVTPLVHHNPKTESFKRPDHPDFWDSAECKRKEFSGIRKNDMALRWEFWILGEMVKEVTYQQVAKDEFALTKAHMEVFYMPADPKEFKR